jgi:hypothetical protein
MKRMTIFLGLPALLLVIGMTGCNKAPAASPAQPAASPVPPEGGDAVQPAPASASANWETALNDYEKFVDEYVILLKKVAENPADTTLVTESMAMAQKAQSLGETITKLQSEITGEDLAQFTDRYTKIVAKLTAQ